MVEINGVALVHQEHFADNIFQMPHVAWPGLLLKKLQRLRKDRGLRRAERRAMFLKEIADKLGNVFPAPT